MNRLRAGSVAATALVAASGSQLGVSVPAAGARSRSASITRSLPGSYLVRQLRGGRSVALFGSEVHGAVDLRSFRSVRAVLLCRRCVFEGSVRADNTIFSQAVDLSGSTFRGIATFNTTTFASDASFDDCVFTRGAAFSNAAFRATAGFSETTFGNDAYFDRATFRDRPDFSGALFRSGASFSRANLARGASFSDAAFSSSSGARFDGVEATGDLTFDRAVFEGPVRLTNARADAVSFRNVLLGRTSSIALRETDATELFLPAAAAMNNVEAEDRTRALALIESTAKVHGDAAAANDADYDLHLIRSRDYSPPVRALDRVFYRDAAGYLVRPLRPLAVLVALAVLAVAVRRAKRRSRPKPVRFVMAQGRVAAAGFHTGRPGRSRIRGRPVVLRASTGFVADVWDTLATIAPKRWSGLQFDERSLAVRLEVLTYRVLFVCFLIALAKANPGLHDMIDALS